MVQRGSAHAFATCVSTRSRNSAVCGLGLGLRITRRGLGLRLLTKVCENGEEGVADRESGSELVSSSSEKRCKEFLLLNGCGNIHFAVALNGLTFLYPAFTLALDDLFPLFRFAFALASSLRR